MFATRCVGGLRVPGWVLCLVVVLFIFAYGAIIRRLGSPDVLERPFIDDPAVPNCDGWAMTHLIFWGFMGFWFPGRHLQALLISLAWEGFEDTLGRTNLKIGGKRLQLIGATDSDSKKPAGEGEDGDHLQWYGRFESDTFYNMTGYVIGSALAKRFWPEDACECSKCRA